jgi:hypothetical protein
MQRAGCFLEHWRVLLNAEERGNVAEREDNVSAPVHVASTSIAFLAHRVLASRARAHELSSNRASFHHSVVLSTLERSHPYSVPATSPGFSSRQPAFQTLNLVGLSVRAPRSILRACALGLAATLGRWDAWRSFGARWVSVVVSVILPGIQEGRARRRGDADLRTGGGGEVHDAKSSLFKEGATSRLTI